ncbi:MAG: arylamine N-acetyltransferase [Bryobacteraceae bacterium]
METVDLAPYLRRIEFTGSLRPDLAMLTALHLAHATHIPFENLDVLLQRSIAIDLPSIEKKLIENRRGGYCFEQNTLFAAVLEQLGFSVKRLGARVLMGATEPRPRTHMLLLVTADREQWLSDVGFGGEGLLLPLRFRAGEEANSFGWKSRIIQQDNHYFLQSLRPEGWFTLYTFTLEEHFPIDYEVANHYTATHPDSHFTRMLIAQLPGTGQRVRLTNRRFTVETPTGLIEDREIPTDEELVDVLANNFGIALPQGTRFPIPMGPTREPRA